MAKSEQEKLLDQQEKDRLAAAQKVNETDTPTPTQRENDLAKLGAAVEPEQSGDPEPAAETRNLNADTNRAYKTRDAKAD